MRHTGSKRSAKPKPAVPVTDRRPFLEPLAVRPAQAAHLLSVSERTLWTLISKGRFQVSRIGNVTLISMKSIRALLDDEAPPPRDVRRLAKESAAAAE